MQIEERTDQPHGSPEAADSFGKSHRLLALRLSFSGTAGGVPQCVVSVDRGLVALGTRGIGEQWLERLQRLLQIQLSRAVVPLAKMEDTPIVEHDPAVRLSV